MQRLIFSTLFIFITLIFSILSIETQENPSFWLTTDLIWIDWKPGCLTTAFCHEPKFQLIHSMLVEKIRENTLTNWPVSDDTLQDQGRSIVTFWSKGSPADIFLTAQVVGKDPTFGFTRPCDETKGVKIFHPLVPRKIQFRAQRYASLQSSTISPEHDRMLLEVRGKCFNASLAIQKHIDRCPWCPDPNLQIHNEIQPVPKNHSHNSTFFIRLHDQDQLIQMIVFLGLTAITIATCTSCVCVFVLYLREKNRRTSCQKENLINKDHSRLSKYNGMISNFHQYHEVIDPLKEKFFRRDVSCNVEWDNKYRPVPHILNNYDSSSSSCQNSEDTLTSPLTSTFALESIYEQASIDPLNAQNVLNTAFPSNSENFNDVSENFT